ncbi:hypothetical protein ACYPKM_01725 [Pseudomonas aeruginosa]
MDDCSLKNLMIGLRPWFINRARRPLAKFLVYCFGATVAFALLLQIGYWLLILFYHQGEHLPILVWQAPEMAGGELQLGFMMALILAMVLNLVRMFLASVCRNICHEGRKEAKRRELNEVIRKAEEAEKAAALLKDTTHEPA